MLYVVVDSAGVGGSGSGAAVRSAGTGAGPFTILVVVGVAGGSSISKDCVDAIGSSTRSTARSKDGSTTCQ
jgi:hypothetical protein